MAAESKPAIVTNPNQELRKQQLEKAGHARQLQALNLQRENILSQRTSNPGRRAALAAALEQIEAQIQALN